MGIQVGVEGIVSLSEIWLRQKPCRGNWIRTSGLTVPNLVLRQSLRIYVPSELRRSTVIFAAVGDEGIEPSASRSRTERSADELVSDVLAGRPPFSCSPGQNRTAI